MREIYYKIRSSFEDELLKLLKIDSLDVTYSKSKNWINGNKEIIETSPKTDLPIMYLHCNAQSFQNPIYTLNEFDGSNSSDLYYHCFTEDGKGFYAFNIKTKHHYQHEIIYRFFTITRFRKEYMASYDERIRI